MCCVQLDAWFGLLQKLDDEVVDNAIKPINSDVPQHLGVPRSETTPQVVGPTPEELESVNELIRFDHMYYRNAPSPTAMEVEVESVDISTELESCGVVSVNPDGQSVVEIPGDYCLEESTDTVSGDEALFSEDLLNLSELDLLELTETLSQLVDSQQVSEQPFMSVDKSAAKISQSQFTSKTAPKKQTICELTTPFSLLDDFSVEPNAVESLDLEQGAPWNSPAASSGRGTGSSSVGSPFSDGLDDDYCSQWEEGYRWEESFTELFPSLV
jgi:hypothetical protein